MGRIVPVFLALIGLAAGVGAGFALRPPPQEPARINTCGTGETPGEPHVAIASPDHVADPEEATHEYVKLNNQFIVPVVENGDVAALVILSINLEVAHGATEQVYQREPKLRDGCLQVLFDHANAGGFKGAFTQSNNMDVLRHALLETARKSLGALVSDVLIVDIVRQDS